MNTTVAGRIEIENPTLEVKEFAKNNLILANPKHISNKVYGFSNYNVPEHVKLYGEYSNKLYLPFGVLKKIYPLIKDTPINVVFKPVEAKKLLSPIVLKEYQQNAIDACLKAKNGVLVAPCGSGKTIMGLILATELKQKTLWIVHTKELLNQSLERAKEIFINYEDKDFGKITEGKVEVGNVMTFATIQTLSKLNLYSLANEFGCVIIDEVQHAVGGENSRTMYYEVLNELNVRYKYGLTATPKRQGGYEKSMFALLGDICYEVSEQDIKKAGRTCKTVMEVINCPTEDTPYIYKTLTKREKEEGKQRGNIDTISLNSFLPTVAYRNDKIIENIMNNVNGKHHQLVLCDRVDHCKILYNHLLFIKENAELEHPLKVALYIGENKDNKEIRNNYDQYDVIIATYSMAKEGTDMPALDTLHLATPISNNQALKQCVGRVQRYYPAKKQSTVYVYRDFNIRFSCRCADLVRQTLKIRKQGYDFSKN